MSEEKPGARFLAWNLGALAVAGAVALAVFFTGAAAGEGGQSEFDARWDDGLAEVARYDAERPIYGGARSYELVQILVKELFDPRTRTKPDQPRPGAVDAMKLVRVEDVPTGRAYRYRQTLTLRVSRRSPERLLDAAAGSQEWCGNAFALVVPRGDALVRHVHSYWDGEGDRSDELPAGTWLEDQLPATLRGVALAAGWKREVRMLPTVLSHRQPATAPIAATIAVEGEERVADRECWRVRVSWDGVSTYWIGREAPHLVVRLETRDGRKATLKSVERTAYWNDPK